MKKLLILILLTPVLSYSMSCDRAEKMGEYMSMNGNKFMDAYKKHKLAGNTDELRVVVDDVNQARKMAHKFPASKTWDFHLWVEKGGSHSW